MTVPLETTWFIADFPAEVSEEGPESVEFDGMELSTHLWTSEEPDDVGVFTVRVTVLLTEEMRTMVRENAQLRGALTNQFAQRLVESLARDSPVEMALNESVPVEHFSYERRMFRFAMDGVTMACVAAVSLAEHAILERFAVVSCDEPSIDRAIQFVTGVTQKV